ncbi:upstream transcription factor 1 isoform X3 [Salmo salar]|uniref:Upstream stimulatory factor 1 n=1 Tax=Salmo salar TaxID=8030 RepID=A0A1S3NRV3_SALSA|nr:upstream transcription factor 1 isoform X3 [Salmo salar]|eukprot:XP_014017936.1 PREDICTED: upstream transcription factor 1 isoform X3 [Salmo salar]
MKEILFPVDTVKMKGQQKSPDPDESAHVIEEGNVTWKGNNAPQNIRRHPWYFLAYIIEIFALSGAVATADDPSAAIATIQSAANFSSEHPIKYLFKTEGAGGQVGELYYPPAGQVTYRVIQVSDGQLEAQSDGATAVSVLTGFPAATQPMTQAVFSQSEGLEGDGTETHYTYYPATIADTSPGTMVTSVVQASDTHLSQSTPTGQLYVMMSPQEVLTGANQRSIAPRTQPYNTKSEVPRTSRDDKRRAQHNEVERRRRDKINNWIVTLSKTIPDCNIDPTKSGQVSISNESKGGILSKACDYIQELRQNNLRLGDDLSTLERLRMDNQLLRQEKTGNPRTRF